MDMRKLVGRNVARVRHSRGLTQEQLADLLGLTPVHINRTIKALEEKGAVKRIARRLTIGNVETLRHIAEFSDIYLHRNNDSKG